MAEISEAYPSLTALVGDVIEDGQIIRDILISLRRFLLYYLISDMTKNRKYQLKYICMIAYILQVCSRWANKLQKPAFYIFCKAMLYTTLVPLRWPYEIIVLQTATISHPQRERRVGRAPTWLIATVIAASINYVHCSYRYPRSCDLTQVHVIFQKILGCQEQKMYICMFLSSIAKWSRYAIRETQFSRDDVSRRVRTEPRGIAYRE